MGPIVSPVLVQNSCHIITHSSQSLFKRLHSRPTAGYSHTA